MKTNTTGSTEGLPSLSSSYNECCEWEAACRPEQQGRPQTRPHLLHRTICTVEEARRDATARAAERRRCQRRQRQQGPAAAADVESAVAEIERKMRSLSRVRTGATEALHELHHDARAFVEGEVQWEEERWTERYAEARKRRYVARRERAAGGASASANVSSTK